MSAPSLNPASPLQLSLWRLLLRTARRIDRDPVSRVCLLAPPLKLYLHESARTVDCQPPDVFGKILRRANRGGEFYRDVSLSSRRRKQLAATDGDIIGSESDMRQMPHVRDTTNNDMIGAVGGSGSLAASLRFYRHELLRLGEEFDAIKKLNFALSVMPQEYREKMAHKSQVLQNYKEIVQKGGSQELIKRQELGSQSSSSGTVASPSDDHVVGRTTPSTTTGRTSVLETGCPTPSGGAATVEAGDVNKSAGGPAGATTTCKNPHDSSQTGPADKNDLGAIPGRGHPHNYLALYELDLIRESSYGRRQQLSTTSKAAEQTREPVQKDTTTRRNAKENAAKVLSPEDHGAGLELQEIIRDGAVSGASGATSPENAGKTGTGAHADRMTTSSLEEKNGTSSAQEPAAHTDIMPTTVEEVEEATVKNTQEGSAAEHQHHQPQNGVPRYATVEEMVLIERPQECDSHTDSFLPQRRRGQSDAFDNILGYEAGSSGELVEKVKIKSSSVLKNNLKDTESKDESTKDQQQGGPRATTTTTTSSVCENMEQRNACSSDNIANSSSSTGVTSTSVQMVQNSEQPRRVSPSQAEGHHVFDRLASENSARRNGTGSITTSTLSTGEDQHEESGDHLSNAKNEVVVVDKILASSSRGEVVAYLNARDEARRQAEELIKAMESKEKTRSAGQSARTSNKSSYSPATSKVSARGRRGSASPASRAPPSGVMPASTSESDTSIISAAPSSTTISESTKATSMSIESSATGEATCGMQDFKTQEEFDRWFDEQYHHVGGPGGHDEQGSGKFSLPSSPSKRRVRKSGIANKRFSFENYDDSSHLNSYLFGTRRSTSRSFYNSEVDSSFHPISRALRPSRFFRYTGNKKHLAKNANWLSSREIRKFFRKWERDHLYSMHRTGVFSFLDDLDKELAAAENKRPGEQSQHQIVQQGNNDHGSSKSSVVDNKLEQAASEQSEEQKILEDIRRKALGISLKRGSIATDHRHHSSSTSNAKIARTPENCNPTPGEQYKKTGTDTTGEIISLTKELSREDFNLLVDHYQRMQGILLTDSSDRDPHKQEEEQGGQLADQEKKEETTRSARTGTEKATTDGTRMTEVEPTKEEVLSQLDALLAKKKSDTSMRIRGRGWSSSKRRGSGSSSIMPEERGRGILSAEEAEIDAEIEEMLRADGFFELEEERIREDMVIDLDTFDITHEISLDVADEDHFKSSSEYSRNLESTSQKLNHISSRTSSGDEPGGGADQEIHVVPAKDFRVVSSKIGVAEGAATKKELQPTRQDFFVSESERRVRPGAIEAGTLLIGHPVGCVFQPTLHRGVIMVTENRGDKGYTGIVLNKMIHMTLAEFLDFCEDQSMEDSVGGPRSARSKLTGGRALLRRRRAVLEQYPFIRGGDCQHENDVQILHNVAGVRGSTQLHDGLFLDGDVEEILSRPMANKHIKLVGGHCIWGHGQLETEVERNLWVFYELQNLRQEIDVPF